MSSRQAVASPTGTDDVKPAAAEEEAQLRSIAGRVVSARIAIARPIARVPMSDRDALPVNIERHAGADASITDWQGEVAPGSGSPSRRPLLLQRRESILPTSSARC